MSVGRRKWTLILTLVAMVVGGLLAYQGAVPQSLQVFGYVFAVIRVAAYLVLFVFCFNQVTAPLLTYLTGDSEYAMTYVRPYRFRCLFWALFLEFFLVWFTF